MRPAQRATTPSDTSSSAIFSSIAACSLTRYRLAAVALTRQARPAHQRFLQNLLGAAGDPVEAQAQRGLEQRAIERPAAPPLEAARRALCHGKHLAERGDGPLRLARRRIGRE